MSTSRERRRAFLQLKQSAREQGFWEVADNQGGIGYFALLDEHHWLALRPGWKHWQVEHIEPGIRDKCMWGRVDLVKSEADGLARIYSDLVPLLRGLSSFDCAHEPAPWE